MHIASLRIVHDRVMLAILCGRIGSIFRVAEQAGISMETLRNLADYAIPLDADARERLLKLNREGHGAEAADHASDPCTGAWIDVDRAADMAG